MDKRLTPAMDDDDRNERAIPTVRQIAAVRHGCLCHLDATVEIRIGAFVSELCAGCAGALRDGLEGVWTR